MNGSRKRSTYTDSWNKVLESLGCGSLEIFLAAWGRPGSDKDVNHALKKVDSEESKERMTAALYCETMFYSGGQFEDGGLKDSKTYVDLGDDWKELVVKALCKRINEAAVDGLSM